MCCASYSFSSTFLEWNENVVEVVAWLVPLSYIHNADRCCCTFIAITVQDRDSVACQLMHY